MNVKNEVLILDSCYSELKYYKDYLNIIKKHKPFFFQFNKKKKYNKEIIIVEEKINSCEQKIKQFIENQNSYRKI